MNQSGIWVSADKAMEAAQNAIADYKKLRWLEYRGYLAYKHSLHYSWFWGFTCKPKKKPRTIQETLRLIKKEDRILISKDWIATEYCEEIATCQSVIRACKVPPTDGKIFLTLEDVRDIRL